MYAGTNPGFQARGSQSIRKKKLLQIGIHIVLTNYKYIKSLFLNILRCNNPPPKTKKKKKTQNTKHKNKIILFFNTTLARIFVFILKLEHLQ